MSLRAIPLGINIREGASSGSPGSGMGICANDRPRTKAGRTLPEMPLSLLDLVPLTRIQTFASS